MVDVRPWLLLVGFLGLGTGCQTGRQDSTLTAARPSAPATLASQMAAMEVEMNRLFRFVEQQEPARALAAAKELRRRQTASIRLVPTSLATLPMSEARPLKTQYQTRANEAVSLLDELIGHLSQNDFEQARTVLHKLDRHRRHCHTLFGLHNESPKAISLHENPIGT